MRPPKLPRPTPVPRVAHPDPARLADLADGGTWPLVEPLGDGSWRVTFCWRDAQADEVLLFANRLTDETDLAATLLERLPGSDMWHASFRMGGGWRASYAFLRRLPGEAAPWETDGHVSLRAALDRGLADPRNPATCRNRGGVAQSVVALPEAPPQPWVEERPGVARGAVSRGTGPSGREVWLWDPPGVPHDAELPLVVALDGEVWTSTQSLPTTLDNLLADAAIPPVWAVLAASGGRDARWTELGDAAAADELVTGLVPWVAARRAVRPGVVVVGQSLGGLTALRAALRHPGAVAAAVSHSASLWLDDLADDVAAAEPGTRIYLAHGTQEWVLTGPHDDLARRLREASVDLEVEAYDGGHDYACWRGGVADGLRWTLGAGGR